MKSLAVSGHAESSNSFTRLDFDGLPIFAGFVDTSPPEFDTSLPENQSRILLRTLAFSCNFRDKGLIVRTAAYGGTACYEIGSELCGEVLAIGDAVRDFEIGDRVITDHWYDLSEGVQAGVTGIPTNHASREFHVLHQDCLLRIPKELSPVIAAAAGLSGQTAYAMIRRLQPRAGELALLTAGSSNTSMFMLRALQARGVETTVVTSSATKAKQMEDLGMSEVVLMENPDDRESSFRKLCEGYGPFDMIVDPFCNLYMPAAIPCLKFSGRYITCGLVPKPLATRNAPCHSTMMAHVITNNISIFGNCLGTRDDLAKMMNDLVAGSFDVTIDTVCEPTSGPEFIHRTFCDPRRLGKVVLEYPQ